MPGIPVLSGLGSNRTMDDGEFSLPKLESDVDRPLLMVLYEVREGVWGSSKPNDQEVKCSAALSMTVRVLK